MRCSDAMICVAAPEVPQIGSCTTRGVTAAAGVSEEPQADRPPSSVAPADVPASTINARRAGEFGFSWRRTFSVARLPLLSFVATDGSLPFGGSVGNHRCSGLRSGVRMHAYQGDLYFLKASLWS